MKQPLLTVIIIFYNGRREAKRTLKTLTPAYQNMEEEAYRVIVVDSNSSSPLEETFVHSFGSNFSYLYVKSNHPSPVDALNAGLEKADTEYVKVMIDGARMLSPGILRSTFDMLKIHENPFVYTLGLHLGEYSQNDSLKLGYTEEVEDAMLATINWEEDGLSLIHI